MNSNKKKPGHFIPVSNGQNFLDYTVPNDYCWVGRITNICIWGYIDTNYEKLAQGYYSRNWSGKNRDSILCIRKFIYYLV